MVRLRKIKRTSEGNVNKGVSVKKNREEDKEFVTPVTTRSGRKVYFKAFERAKVNYGNFTAKDLTVTEAAINKRVLRVPLNLDVKNCQEEEESTRVEPKRKRGRPPKIKSSSGNANGAKQTKVAGSHITLRSAKGKGENSDQSETVKESAKSGKSVRTVNGKLNSKKVNKTAKRLSVVNKRRKFLSKAQFSHKQSAVRYLRNRKVVLGTFHKFKKKIPRKVFKLISKPEATFKEDKETVEQSSTDEDDMIVQQTIGEPSLDMEEESLKYEILNPKLNYPFHKLVGDVKTMKLPTPQWKIKVIIREKKITAIKFTNKSAIERGLNFPADKEIYEIIIDNQRAQLLASPGHLNDAREIEILLDIIENINKNDPMIKYV